MPSRERKNCARFDPARYRGLPGLNGVEAARQILKIIPESKIVFLAQETAAEVAREALNVGTSGYVVKSQAGKKLLGAIEAVLQGKRFVSSGLDGHELATTGGHGPDHQREILTTLGADSLSWRNSASDIIDSVRPQSRQTNSFENAKMGGRSRLLSPGK
jgi:DNA-binding response OmpR family regulator